MKVPIVRWYLAIGMVKVLSLYIYIFKETKRYSLIDHWLLGLLFPSCYPSLYFDPLTLLSATPPILDLIILGLRTKLG